MKFTSTDGNTTIEARYDYMGRRAWKKVTTKGTVTLHEAFIYRGYLQIAAENLLEGKRWSEHLITSDPTQPTATRPLAIEQHISMVSIICVYTNSQSVALFSAGC